MNPQNDSLQNKTSFYYPFFLLPPDKRNGLEALYRFCWAADEISDSSDPIPLKRKKLGKFKKELADCLGRKSPNDLFQNLEKTIERFNLSREPLLRILKGVERDLRPIRFETFAELHQYCLQVAGGPGLASMEIFGFRDKAHRDYAENLGVFLQIVNMTRDYQEDMAMGRRYFPAVDFRKFHLNPALIGENNSHWASFVEFQLDRAWSFLEKARASLTKSQRSRLATAEAISAVYVKLFQKLRNQPHSILKGRTSLSKADKIFSVIGAAGRCGLWQMTED